MIGDSIYRVIYSNGPISFEDMVPRVQAYAPEATANQIASELGALVRTRRVFLNQEETGFLAVKENQTQKYLAKAQKSSLPDHQLKFSNV